MGMLQTHYAGEQMDPNAMGASYNHMVPDGMMAMPGQQPMDPGQMAMGMGGQVGYMNQQQMQPGMGGMDPGQMAAMGMDGQVGYMNQQQMGIEDEQNYMAAGQMMDPGGGAADHGLITDQPSADPGGKKRGSKLSKEEKNQKKERKKKKKDTMPDAPLPDHEASNALAHNWHVRRACPQSPVLCH